MRYVKAIRYGRECVMRMEQAKETTDDYFKGEWYNGTGHIQNSQFSGEKDFTRAVVDLEKNWGYENLQEITKEEFDNYIGEDFDFIKWKSEKAIENKLDTLYNYLVKNKVENENLQKREDTDGAMFNELQVEIDLYESFISKVGTILADRVMEKTDE